MRINKYLASCELGSRRKVEEYIVSKKIKVNGVVITDLAYNVEDTDIVEYNNKKVSPQQKKIYIMLNKPKCYITTLKDEQNRRIVTDLLKGVKEKVFPIGRLDFNTEGLLLLTNDGDFANNVIHPSKHISKTYEVLVKVQLTNKQLKSIRNGILIDDRKTLPAQISLIGADNGYNIYHITIFEGRNREIRKMFEALNVKIYNLKRISIGNLNLGDLEMGKFRYLSEEEKSMVFGG